MQAPGGTSRSLSRSILIRCHSHQKETHFLHVIQFPPHTSKVLSGLVTRRLEGRVHPARRSARCVVTYETSNISPIPNHPIHARGEAAVSRKETYMVWNSDVATFFSSFFFMIAKSTLDYEGIRQNVRKIRPRPGMFVRLASASSRSACSNVPPPIRYLS